MFAPTYGGFSIEHHAALGSSNDRAMDCAVAGMDRHWVIVDQQTGGRGRQGRVWESPPGNLYASLALVDPCAMALSPQLGFVAGLATQQALASLTPFGARLRLKWPNDVLLDGAKLSGQLLEGRSQSGHLCVVIGIGINLRHHPDQTPYPATDLLQAGVELTPSSVLHALCDEFSTLLGLWSQGLGFSAIRQRWLERAAYLERPIEVRTERGPLKGLFKGLDAEGRLLLQVASSAADGLTVIEAGDFYPLDLSHSQG